QHGSVVGAVHGDGDGPGAGRAAAVGDRDAVDLDQAFAVGQVGDVGFWGGEGPVHRAFAIARGAVADDRREGAGRGGARTGDRVGGRKQFDADAVAVVEVVVGEGDGAGCGQVGSAVVDVVGQLALGDMHEGVLQRDLELVGGAGGNGIVGRAAGGPAPDRDVVGAGLAEGVGEVGVESVDAAGSPPSGARIVVEEDAVAVRIPQVKHGVALAGRTCSVVDVENADRAGLGHGEGVVVGAGAAPGAVDRDGGNGGRALHVRVVFEHEQSVERERSGDAVVGAGRRLDHGAVVDDRGLHHWRVVAALDHEGGRGGRDAALAVGDVVGVDQGDA